MLIVDANWEQIKNTIFTKVAAKHGVSVEEVKEIYKDIFYKTKLKLQMKCVPKVLLHNFGTFQPCLGKINKQIYTWIFRYQDGIITREQLKEKLEFLLPVRNRIKREMFGKCHKPNKFNKFKNNGN